jgi:cation diffusion facilitator CzcD-associated flavoprotein CzcO
MNNVKKILVIGAGIAGLTAVETLRRLSFQGEISIISAEDELPYDRPPLSVTERKTTLRSAAPALMVTSMRLRF